MREIKFRAWDKTNNRMIEWPEIFAYQMLYEIIPNSMNDQNIYSLMQYTGIKDKNGVEIYEGDIYNMGDKNIKYVAVWNDTGLTGKQLGSRSYAGISFWKDTIEVVGNIYQNPELRRKKQ